MLNQFGTYEMEFLQWMQDGYPGATDATVRYIEHLTDPKDDTRPREGKLWEHQWDSFLRVVYAHEIRRRELALPDGVLLNVVTGGGKTAIIAALMVWLNLAHNIKKFVLLCPNLIVRDRLEEDFHDGKVFDDRGLIPRDSNLRKDDFALTTLGGDRQPSWANMLGANVILGNIQQFYTSNRAGRVNLSSLIPGPEFAVFNDEAHNSPAPEWDDTLEKLRPQTILRVDTTATPDRADGKTPDSTMIYEYQIQDALADRLVKTPVVYQPNIETVELTYTDAKTGEKRGVEEIDWAEVDRLGLNATQWVTDDKPMRQQMAIALQRLAEQERRAGGRYHPVLFVVAVCKLDAQQAAKTLQDHFRVKTLLVTEDSPDEDRKLASALRAKRWTGDPYKAVVSVLMLREGWDVPEVGVVLLLRKFGSPVYGQQVIGRGLRRVRNAGMRDEEPQICAVVDHPKLEHQWLWDMFSSKVRTGVGVDDEFDETEDLPDPLPRQILDKPENFIDIPPPSDDLDDDGFDIDVAQPPEPLKDWREALAKIAYPTQTTEITDQKLSGVKGKELTAGGWTTRTSAPEDVDGALADIPQEDLAEHVKDELLAMAGRLLDGVGHTLLYRGRIYAVLLEHVRSNFLEGTSLGLAEPHQVQTASKMLYQVEENIKDTPGLVEGMVKYGD